MKSTRPRTPEGALDDGASRGDARIVKLEGGPAAVGGRAPEGGGPKDFRKVSRPHRGAARSSVEVPRVPEAGWVTARTLAAMLKVHPKTISVLTVRDGMPCIRVGGRLVRYDPHEVVQWLAARRDGQR